MSWQELDSDLALSEGADLWIVGDLDQSKWAQKINWYLNFQLRRAQFHQTPQVSSPLVALAETWEVELPEITVKATAPLLIESSRLLPNRMTVQITASSTKAWVEQIKDVWQQLNQPSLRVYLPQDMAAQDLREHWRDPSRAQVATYVVEPAQ